MSEDVWSVIKYKPKDGCEDEFIEALGRLKEVMKSIDGDRTSNFVRLDTGEIAQINRFNSLDVLIDGQIDGLTWLDSVDHLLEKNEEGSRTDAFSGFELDI